MRNTFGILFYIKRKNLLRSGLAPIMCRITVSGTVAHFSTQLAVAANDWSVHRGCVVRRTGAARIINRQLDDIRFAVEEKYRSLASRGALSTARDLREAYFGRNGRSSMLLEFFHRHNLEFSRKVDVSRSRSSYEKYLCVYAHLSHYVRAEYRRDDVSFSELDSDFATGFESYLRLTRRCSAATAHIYMIALKHICLLARQQGVTVRDIFGCRRSVHAAASREYLTMTELRRVMSLAIGDMTLRKVRDSFIFSCFTGLAYTDLRMLTAADFRRDDAGQRWIVTHRKKTGTAVRVVVLPSAARILDACLTDDPAVPLFPLPSNGWCNVCLRRLMTAAGIDRRITFHCARHTFATTVTLSMGVPIETVSKLLGHSNIKTTQIYADVTAGKLHDDMRRLTESLARADCTVASDDF